MREVRSISYIVLCTLAGAGILYAKFPVKALRIAGTLFLIGILFFSGSLYALTLLKATGSVGLGGIGIITPIGGVFFIAGCLSLFYRNLEIKKLIKGDK